MSSYDSTIRKSTPISAGDRLLRWRTLDTDMATLTTTLTSMVRGDLIFGTNISDSELSCAHHTMFVRSRPTYISHRGYHLGVIITSAWHPSHRITQIIIITRPVLMSISPCLQSAIGRCYFSSTVAFLLHWPPCSSCCIGTVPSRCL